MAACTRDGKPLPTSPRLIYRPLPCTDLLQAEYDPQQAEYDPQQAEYAPLATAASR
ncbi:uncharacterized protein SCHCODRAFT_02640336 [Schizophyllum commune H4-8]|uniref:uncharacterized protein n=1 Tax=Schizophyllum commune (strain H4-8 / FGSC 9210) TaxID=578458 RepID=UPI00215E2DC9|nr:uncharacterized protein SCHCODRAFT_02640336 [Schizophyllum commune H4-8]KAI5886930.1 hypothetical protein SCHCODRAFT_02640336 [Schizophyllum commune H4-8]